MIKMPKLSSPEFFRGSLIRFFVMLTIGLFMLGNQAQANAWDEYKARFVNADGAVVDNANHMIHSESQGYGLMFALAYNDKDMFGKILNFAETNMKNPDNGLYYWAYYQNQDPHCPDKNNASDGDLFIAWALIKAGRAWNERSYLKRAEQILTALQNTVMTKFADLQVMLPGETGFYYNTSVIINPSYLICPALRDVADYTHIKVWKELAQDTQTLLKQFYERAEVKVKLPPDWIELDASGKMAPAAQWPSRSSYDAIRVPIYLYWLDPQNENLKPWRDWFSQFEDGRNPAWVNIATGDTADYMLPPGLVAVRDLTLGRLQSEPVIDDKDDYYNASLKLLCFLARARF